MQIKPFGVIGYSEDEEKAFREKNIKRAHRDFFIYDEIYSPITSYELNNKLFAGVVQVTKLLVNGMPDEEGYLYDKDKQFRTTFVKSLYIYNAFMNNTITDVSERFSKAILRPIIGITSAYTDTKQYIASHTENNYELVDNDFGINIFHFENRSLTSILCNPVRLREGYIVKTMRLDVPDPRYNFVRYLNKASSSDTMNIPTRFYGKDLIRNGETNIHSYASSFKNNDTFSEDNMLNISKKIYGNKIRFKREEGLLPYQQFQMKMTTDLIDKKRALNNLIIDITKASAYSLFESFTMQYETGKRSGFKIIKTPFKQYHIEYMETKMNFVHTEFIKLCEKIVELFGPVRILLWVNDIEHISRCIFLNDLSETNRVITIRKTKLECVNDFITETMYGKNDMINNFKEQHDMDLLNYYSYQNNDSQYQFQGLF
jgi:hypothetical protein